MEERIGTPIPSVTMSAMYPFVFDSIKDPGLSCLLGVDFSSLSSSKHTNKILSTLIILPNLFLHSSIMFISILNLHIIPSVTMSAMYPFVFDSIKDPGLSCLLGVDFSGGIILFNQLKSKNHTTHTHSIQIILNL